MPPDDPPQKYARKRDREQRKKEKEQQQQQSKISSIMRKKIDDECIAGSHQKEGQLKQEESDDSSRHIYRRCNIVTARTRFNSVKLSVGLPSRIQASKAGIQYTVCQHQLSRQPWLQAKSSEFRIYRLSWVRKFCCFSFCHIYRCDIRKDRPRRGKLQTKQAFAG